MLPHPDVLLEMGNLRHQDDIREAELWQLARQARQERTVFLHQLARRLIAPLGRLVSRLWSTLNTSHPIKGRSWPAADPARAKRG